MPTNYPSSLDTTTQLKNDSIDSTVTATTHEALHNNTSDAIIAIETILGTAPSGSYATVKAAIADIIGKVPVADQTITSGADIIPLIVKQGNSAYISNLLEVRSSTNSIKFYVDRNGNINTQGINVAGTPLAASNLSNGVTGTGAVVLAASPTLTGNPLAPTQTAGNNTTRIATTAFVTTAVAAVTVPVTSVFSRTGAVVAATNDYTDLQIQNSPTNKLTTTGDLLYASGANTLARRAIGSAGDALRVFGGLPTWKTLAFSSTTPSDPTTSSSGSSLMVGIGYTITPTATGKIEVTICGNWQSATNSTYQIQLVYGTGSAPSNGAASTGTAISGLISDDTGTSKLKSFSLTAGVSGLTVGTTYWFDLVRTFSGQEVDNTAVGVSNLTVVGREVG